ncbi:unnamed protein product [Xylocopa violacea]|uniref:NADH dehydrogenase [ubiquinone] 1 alpha subcomplex subunit 7 n=1 Tax=Xylocopa violacea TaxID=135666 RepID=A0ABP1NCL8_XYLVO
MTNPIGNRSIAPLIKMLSDVCRGKPGKDSLRFADELAARTQPMPTVPDGPYHKTSKVYYYTRDARRLVQPPIEVYSNTEPRKIDTAQIKLLAPRFSSDEK